MSIDVKYDTTPCDGSPGTAWEEFKRRFRNIATRSDDRGFSLADHFDGMSMKVAPRSARYQCQQLATPQS